MRLLKIPSQLAVCLLLLATTMTSAEGPDTSLISNQEAPSQESVAHEILEIQQHLGGSIVSDRQSLQEFPSSRNSEEKTVRSLRDAAWRLDRSAEKLERSELYKQADALRNLAQQFRLDARAIRAQSGE